MDIDDYGRLLLDRKEAMREVAVIEDRIRFAVAELVSTACGGVDFSEPGGVVFRPEELAVASHDCLKSPIESCVFDNTEDPGHCACLFCELPEDRERVLV